MAADQLHIHVGPGRADLVAQSYQPVVGHYGPGQQQQDKRGNDDQGWAHGRCLQGDRSIMGARAKTRPGG